MAGSFALNLQLSATANNATVAGVANYSATITGSNLSSITQALTTTPAALTPGNLSTLGPLLIQNLSSVNVVVYYDSGATQITDTIPPGEAILKRNPGATPYLKVASGTGSILITGCEQ